MDKGIIKLNLGCDRYHKREGWINVDINPNVINPNDPSDLVADVRKLPHKDNSVYEIIASKIMEHFPDYKEGLREWYRVLKPGGKITIIVPNARVMRMKFLRGEIPPEDALMRIVGSFDVRELLGHHTLWWRRKLKEEVEKFGFKVEEEFETEKGKYCGIIAIKNENPKKTLNYQR